MPGAMKFQVGKFTCELSLDDSGQVKAQWLPSQPKYLNRVERLQYQACRDAFMEHLDHRDPQPCRNAARRDGA
jgi:hypothetical protein